MKPMLAKPGTEDILSNENYVFEPKLDGIRALCIKEEDKLTFISRNGHTITKDYPEFTFSKQIKAKRCVLDGEIVVYDDDGNPNFQLWQDGKHEATYVVFDMLQSEDENLCKKPLHERKKILQISIKEKENLQLMITTENGKQLFDLIKKRNGEGVIAKRKESLYRGGRSDDWLKIKLTNTIDCVVLGFTVEKRALTSFALGLYEKKKLRFVGKLGIGFSEKFIKEWREKLEDIKVDKSETELPKDVIPVKPQHVVEIRYLQFTNEKKLRAPQFVRMRADKDSKECLFET